MISRGKVEISISYIPHGAAGGAIRLDPDFTAAYLKALQELRDTFGLPDDISVMTVARNGDVFTHEREEEDPEEVWARIAPVLQEAGEAFTQMRSVEGAKIQADIVAKLGAIAAWADQIEEISHTDTVGYRDKLETRLRAILADHDVTVDEGRLLTECAVWCCVGDAESISSIIK